MNKKRQILTATQTVSDEFSHTGERMIIEMSVHNGGTWKVQVQSAHDPTVWFDVDGTFSAVGQQHFRGSPVSRYRLSGGSVGAVAYILSSWAHRDVD